MFEGTRSVAKIIGLMASTLSPVTEGREKLASYPKGQVVKLLLKAKSLSR